MAKRKDEAPEPTLPDIPDSVLDEMVATYRQIRKAVYREATKAPSIDPSTHSENQQIFRDFVTELCSDAKLAPYMTNTADARQRLWWHIWTKIRYAGIRAEGASNEIKNTKDIFNNYDLFTGTDWKIEFKRRANEEELNNLSVKSINLHLCGKLAREYFEQAGAFEGMSYYRNIPKIKRTINLAGRFSDFARTNPNAFVIDFLSGGIDPKHIWRIHRYITKNKSYLSNITALHLMMDLGYEVMKPDRVIARAFFQLGWLQQVVELPPGISEAQIVPGGSDEDPEATEDDGRSSGTFHYIHPNISRPIVDLSRLLAARIRQDDLKADIGWCTDNKLREFDIFMVKYGQEPEPKLGLHRNLSTETPYGAFRSLPATG